MRVTQVGVELDCARRSRARAGKASLGAMKP
jgi:hypothetical protein